MAVMEANRSEHPASTGRALYTHCPFSPQNGGPYEAGGCVTPIVQMRKLGFGEGGSPALQELPELLLQPEYGLPRDLS